MSKEGMISIQVTPRDPNVIRYCVAQRLALKTLCEWLNVDEDLATVAMKEAFAQVTEDADRVLELEPSVCKEISDLAAKIAVHQIVQDQGEKRPEDAIAFIQELMRDKADEEEGNG